MDTYVVRIYRRDMNEPRKLAGVVERAGTEDKRVFHDVEELLGILFRERLNRQGNKAVGKKKNI